MRRSWLLVLSPMLACNAIVTDTFTFSDPLSAAGAGGAAGQAGTAGQAGASGQAGQAGGAGDCPTGDPTWLRLASLLDEPRRAHVCVRYAGEKTYYVSQNAAQGLADGLEQPTVTRYRSLTSGLVSVGLSPIDAPNPCAAPVFTRDLCLPPGAHGTLVVAGDRGASPPTAAIEYIPDMPPGDVNPSRYYSRLIHAVSEPSRPWLDAIIWSTVSSEWILPFRNLQFGVRPVSQAKKDAFNPINEFGYIAGFFGPDTVRYLDVILPLSIDTAGIFQLDKALLDAYQALPSSTPVTLFAWGNLRPEAHPDGPSYPGLRLLACLDSYEPGQGTTGCFDTPRAANPDLKPLPRLRAGNASPSPVRYCLLPFSAASSYAPRNNLPGWKEASPQGIVVEPFQMLRDRLIPHYDFVITSLPIEKTCDQVEQLLADAGYDQDSCTTTNLACDDLIASAMRPEHSTATVTFDGLLRRPIFHTLHPSEGLVTARLSNIMRGDQPVDASLDDAPHWPGVKPNLTYFHAGVYTLPEGPPESMKATPTEVEATFAPAPGARFRWKRGDLRAISAEPVDFAARAGQSFVLWAGGDASLLGTDAPDAPFLWVCANEPSDAPTLDCQRIAMVPEP